MREIDPNQIEVQILGRVLEGRGAISSDLKESEWPEFAEALRSSIERIQDTEYSSCIDGRQTIELASGDPEELRPRKAGGGLTPFVMRGVSSPEFRQELILANGQAGLFEKVTEVNNMIGRKESAHAGVMPDGSIVFDCGAAGGLIEHTAGLSTMTLNSPNTKAVFGLMGQELPSTLDAASLLGSISRGAGEFSQILYEKAWDGQAYVQQLMKKDPKAVELLEAQPNEVHGHAEVAVGIVDEEINSGEEPTIGIGKATLKRLTGKDIFVINLNEFRRGSSFMTQNKADQIRFILGNLLYHTDGVYKNLGDGSQPVFYLKLHA